MPFKLVVIAACPVLSLLRPESGNDHCCWPPCVLRAWPRAKAIVVAVALLAIDVANNYYHGCSLNQAYYVLLWRIFPDHDCQQRFH